MAVKKKQTRVRVRMGGPPTFATLLSELQTAYDAIPTVQTAYVAALAVTADALADYNTALDKFNGDQTVENAVAVLAANGTLLDAQDSENSALAAVETAYDALVSARGVVDDAVNTQLVL